MLIKGRTKIMLFCPGDQASIDKTAAMHYNVSKRELNTEFGYRLPKLLLIERCRYAENLQKMSAGYVCPLRP